MKRLGEVDPHQLHGGETTPMRRSAVPRESAEFLVHSCLLLTSVIDSVEGRQAKGHNSRSEPVAVLVRTPSSYSLFFRIISAFGEALVPSVLSKMISETLTRATMCYQ